MKLRAPSLLLLLVSVSCDHGSSVLSLAPPASPPPASEYDSIRSRWTRSARVLKALDTPLEVHATLFSPEFLGAYLSKRAQIFHCPPAEQALEERRLRVETEGTFTLLVSASSHDWNWIDFEREGSIWRIALVNQQGEQLRPSRILLERRVTAVTTELFPTIAEFHRVYWLRFPLTLPDGRPLLRGGGEERLILLFAGPMGRAELVWRLR